MAYTGKGPEAKTKHEIINPMLEAVGLAVQHFKVATEYGNKGASKKVWIYDIRTNMHFTLKENRLKEEDLGDFVKCYKPENWHERKHTWSEKKGPDGRWRCFDIKDILKRDKTNLDIFWIKDESLEDVDSLPDPDVIANELVEELQDTLEQLQEIAGDMENGKK